MFINIEKGASHLYSLPTSHHSQYNKQKPTVVKSERLVLFIQAVVFYYQVNAFLFAFCQLSITVY